MTRSTAASPPRCTIVPPHLLERLAHSDDEAVAQSAREALLDVDRGLLHRHAHAHPQADPGKQPKLAPSTVAGGPVRLISDAAGGTDLPGTQVRGEGDPATDDVAATEAYDGLGDTWTLFAEAFERNSLDGKGLPLRATVHYGKDYDNAFWDGTQMVFGDGDGEVFGRFTASLDVIGHELGHGVTEHTAGLMYQGQSGALNESMSDVFGSLVKQHKLGQEAADADWLIGAELLIGEAAGMALRSMKAPGTAYDTPLLGKDPQPGHMDDYVETDSDHGGVHINSGIPNHAFYLLATGLGGHAWEAPGQIWYAALTGSDIAADCDFVTFAGLTQRAAEELFGADSPQAQAVAASWRDVGVLQDAPGEDGETPSEPAPQGEDEGSEPEPAPGDGPPAPGPGSEVLQVSRTGGFAGRTISTTVDLQQLPQPVATAWRSVLAGTTLQALDGREMTHPDTYCYGVSCALPPLDVRIPEQHLPEDLRQLFDVTLKEG